MSYFPPTGSTVAFQSDATKLAANVSVTGGFVNVSGSIASAPFPASVSGVGLFNVNQVGNGSILAVIPGSVAVMPSPHSVSGVGTFNVNPVGAGSMITTLINSSVTTLQGTNPWFVQLTSGSVITTGGNSSVQVVGVMPPQSVSGVGTFNINPVGNGSMINVLTNSSVAALQGTNPWFVQPTSGSVFSYQAPGSILAVSATVNTGNSSVMLTAGINTIGSVAVLQGTNPWVTGFSVSPSIVGTYSEDAAHTTADKGVFVLQVRNDTMSSITSADGDYSPIGAGPIGEVIVANSPITKWIQAQTSVMYGTSVQAVAPQGASVFTYITGAQVVNASATNAIVKFTGGLGSVLAWTTAPANGGSNIVFANALKTGENSGVSASINGLASVYLSMQGFISKT